MHAHRGKAIVRAVLFDGDATLLDSYHPDTQAYVAMFHALGMRDSTCFGALFPFVVKLKVRFHS